MPCNSAHYFYKQVAPEIDIQWINMLECVSNRLVNEGFNSPLILGGYVTTYKKIYSEFIQDAQYLNVKQNNIIEALIEQIKLNGNASRETALKFKSLIKENISRSDSIIFACTELPLVFRMKKLFGVPIFDSSEIYAEESKNYGYY